MDLPTMAVVRRPNANPQLFLTRGRQVYSCWKESNAWNAGWTPWNPILSAARPGEIRKLVSSRYDLTHPQLWAWSDRGLWTCWQQGGDPDSWSDWQHFGTPNAAITDVATITGSTNSYVFAATADGRLYGRARRNTSAPLDWYDWEPLVAPVGGALLLHGAHLQSYQAQLLLWAATDLGLLRLARNAGGYWQHWTSDTPQTGPGLYGLLGMASVPLLPSGRIMQFLVADRQLVYRTQSGDSGFGYWQDFGYPGEYVAQLLAAHLSDGRIQVWALLMRENTLVGIQTRWMTSNREDAGWTDWSELH